MEDINKKEFISYLLENFPKPPACYEVAGPLWEVVDEFAKAMYEEFGDDPQAADLLENPSAVFCAGARMGARFLWVILHETYNDWVAKRLLEEL